MVRDAPLRPRLRAAGARVLRVEHERARFRFQIMASHAEAQIDRAVDVFERCLSEARMLTSAG